MKVKIVFALIFSMLLLTSCFWKDTDKSSDDTISWDSESIYKEVSESDSTYSSIWGSGGAPEDTDFEFNN